jgi:transposase
MLIDLLLPTVPGLALESYLADEDVITLIMTSTCPAANCPLCGLASSRQHSHYQRSPGDLPWSQLHIRLALRVRRFFCDNPACPRSIFVERLGSAILAYARRTSRLDAQLRVLAQALGGQAGAVVVQKIGMPVSASTLLRLLRQTPEPAAATPRVLGVDDFALRKGQTYGTILVDLERHQPIDLLPDRTAETLAAWLRAHPGVEIISRDRASAYADGAAQGAPAATQVADRFHLLTNLREALQRLLERQTQELHAAAAEVAAQAAPVRTPAEPIAAEPAVPVQPEPPLETAAPPLSHRQALFAEVKQLREQGVSQREIAARLHIHRQTVRRYIHAHELPKRRPPKTVSEVRQHRAYLLQRWAEGCHNVKMLWIELKARGYSGSYASVWRALAPLIRAEAVTPSARPPTPTVQALSPRQAAWLLVLDPEKLKPEEEAYRVALQALSPLADAAQGLAQRFVNMVRDRDAQALDAWLADATASTVPELQRFAGSLRRDYAAVSAALKLPWSNGQVEGQVNRLKLIKRQMFGRAKLGLLRLRVLHPT